MSDLHIVVDSNVGLSAGGSNPLTSLYSGLRSQGVEAIMMAGQASSIEDLTHSLGNQFHAIQFDTIYLYSHGKDGGIQFGPSAINANNLRAYAQDFQALGSLLKPGGDLLLFGCNLASTAEGKDFIRSLAAITGRDVGASDDLTGLGGDWDLEYQVGDIKRLNTDLLTGLNVQGSLSQDLEPFRGITTNGKVKRGLYHLKSTGIAIEPMKKAAQSFLDSLSAEQRAITQFSRNSDIKRRWTNVSQAERAGVSYQEMTEDQIAAANNLLKAFLSPKGYEQSKNIMLINGYLADATGNQVRYGSEQFWLTVYGKPSTNRPWGWRLEGHHLVLSVNIVGDQVVMTPTFMGAEPTTIPAGEHAGVTVMQEQEAAARAFIGSLNSNQQAIAHISDVKSGTNILSEAYKDNAVIPKLGIPASELSKKQQDLLMKVVRSYSGQYRQKLSAERLKEVRSRLDQTTFLWIGGDQPDSPIYYRIHSPVALIEFDQQRALSLPGDPSVPLRSHVHTMVRTPNGNDYGESILNKHLKREHGYHADPHRHA